MAAGLIEIDGRVRFRHPLVRSAVYRAAAPEDRLQQARLERMRAQIAFARNRGRDAPPLLLDAAQRLAPLDARLARETYLEALAAAIHAGRTNSGPGVVEIARAARAAPPPPRPARAIDRLLDGLATRYAEGYPAGLPVLQRALREFRRDHGPDGDDVRWLWLACLVAQDICDDEAWPALACRQVRLARDVGGPGGRRDLPQRPTPPASPSPAPPASSTVRRPGGLAPDDRRTAPTDVPSAPRGPPTRHVRVTPERARSRCVC